MKISSPNFTQIPNDLLDSMSELSPSEFKVAMLICRATFGWQKKWETMSISGIMKLSGLARATVVSALEKLYSTGVLERRESGNSFAYAIKTTPGSEIEPVQNLNQTGSKIEPPPVQNLNRTISINKEDKEKNPDSPVGVSLFIDSWCKAYQEFFHAKYLFQGGKDGAAVKRLLASGFEPPALIEIAKAAWRKSSVTGSEFWNCGKSADICGFAAHFNGIRAELARTPKEPVGGNRRIIADGRGNL